MDGEIEELYDLEADPEELHNLALEEEYRHVLAEYRQKTVAELKRTGAGMADNLPPVGTNRKSPSSEEAH